MKHLLPILTLLAWSLWFGGGVALLIFVSRLFLNDHNIAVVAAPQMFHLFERCQLVLAGIALPCAVAWRTHARSTAAAALVALLLLALVIAIISATWITPAIEDLRIAGQSASPEFRRLHYVSIIAYLLELTGLLIAGSLIPATFTRRSDPLLKGCI